MTAIRQLAAAAAVLAALPLSPAAAQPLAHSPDVVYHAPSWWITAVVQGKQATLRTGVPDLDSRMNVWLIGFGHGLGERCGLPEGRRLQEALDRHIAARPALRHPGEQGSKDGRRFAEINGCASADASAARRTIASIDGSPVVADLADRNADRREPDRRDERRHSDQPNTQLREVSPAREAIVINRSGQRIDILRMSETADTDWGTDRLGRDVLPSGDGVRVALGGSRSCHYDLQVVYADTRLEQRMNVDLCANPRVVFDGSSARVARPTGGTPARLAVDGSSSNLAR